MAALKPEYMANAKWVMNSATLAALGKLKDLDGRGLFAPNIVAGVPINLFGFEIVIDEFVADLGSNAIVAYFGQFDLAYEIVTNFEAKLTIDPYSTKGMESYYLRSFLGGMPTMGQAVKCIKCATS